MEAHASQVDELVRDEAARIREGLDADRHHVRDALLRAAREVLTAGDEAAASIVALSVDVGSTFFARGELVRAQRVELGARVAHDRVRAAAQRLADEIRAMEGDLVAPLTKVSRTTLGHGLPELRRIFRESTQHHPAALAAASPTERARLERELDTWVEDVRVHAREQVDSALARMNEATARGVATIEGATEALPERVRAATGTTIAPALRALGQEVTLPRRRWWTSLLVGTATALALLLVVASTLIAYAVGLVAAAALFGAIVLSGTYAPPVGAGFVAAAIGTLLAAGVTDLLFNVLGDWRDGRDDGLLGATLPVRATGRLPRALDVAPVLDALRLRPPRAPAETPAPAPFAPFEGLTAERETTDPGLVDPTAHRRTRELLHADVVRDVTTDETGPSGGAEEP